MLRIINGEVYDPINGINGEVRDICVQDGRIVADAPGARVTEPLMPLAWWSCRAAWTCTATSPGQK